MKQDTTKILSNLSLRTPAQNIITGILIEFVKFGFILSAQWKQLSKGRLGQIQYFDEINNYC